MTRILVNFGLHLSEDRIAGKCTMLAVGANVVAGRDNREFVVEVFRSKKLDFLESRLALWEARGSVARWTVIAEDQ